MQEKAEDQMGSPQCPHLPLSPHLLTSLTLALLLIAVCSCGYLSFSAFLTVLVTVLPPSLFFVFSKRNQPQESNLVKNPRDVEVRCDGRTADDASQLRKRIQGEAGGHRVNGFPPARSPNPSPASEGAGAEAMVLGSVDQIPAHSDRSTPDDEQPPGGAADRVPASTDGSASDDESSVEDVDRAPDSSESSISDEEGLIEIALPDGHSVGPGGLKGTTRRNSQGFLLDLLAEMNEEDNLIEIDIAVGSVKCPRLGIRA